MFYITQSNDIERLFDFLLADYQQKSDNIFDEFTVIVPAKVMGEWLKKQVADRAGISTLVVTEFWGRYQWTLMQAVLKKYAQIDRRNALRVPDVAMLSRNVMQWRLFGFFSEYQAQILADSQHPLYPLLEPLSELNHDLVEEMAGQKASENQATRTLGEQNNWLYTPSFLAKPVVKTGFNRMANNAFTKIALDDAHQTALDSASQQRLWQLAGDMASMLSRYMTYRPDWLAGWADNQPLPIENMMVYKAEFFANLTQQADPELPPEWLLTHYTQLENAQRFLWQHLFAQTYQYRQNIETQFWYALENHAECRAMLPKSLTLFTIQMLPNSELTLMRRLAQYMDIKLLHYNPSALFWADIVDEKWLLSQQLLRPESVYLKDSGHTLLSRFGKQSREIFAMLAHLSGNEDSPNSQVVWQDEFVENDEPKTVLAQLQQDILMLEKGNTALKIEEVISQIHDRKYLPNRQWQLGKQDNSLSIHGCHGMIRQLEVLRSLIIGWLNYVDDPVLAQRHRANLVIPEPYHRHISDILILLPDLEAQQAVIETVFPAGKGADGYILPAKVTGVLSKDINQLWSAIIGYFVLHTQPTSRFERNMVFDWLMLPSLYESYGLNQTQMARACDLLQQAGFIRGFDEIHLQQSLHESDDDYRFTFAYALERLVAGVLMPHAVSTEFGETINQYGEAEKILPLPQMQLADSAIVSALCEIFATLDRFRNLQSSVLDNPNLQNATAESNAHTAEFWLDLLESFIHEKFGIFEQTTALKAIWSARNSFEKNISANKRQFNRNPASNANLAHVITEEVQPDRLPLQLGFILSSMQMELASQQVSAEPAGVITFGRLGALRNLPYKLVAMMDMNLNNFPKRDVANRYDLMQVGKGQRGDRFREDDDLGAFLDAILSAKQACWLFYDRASMTQTQEQLPASPVGELIDFLQSEVMWQTQADGMEKAKTNPDLDLDLDVFPQDIVQAWLQTKHEMLPFDKQYFTLNLPTPDDKPQTQRQKQLENNKKPLYPVAQLWHDVYEQLEKHKQSPQGASSQPSTPVVTLNHTQLRDWWYRWEMQKTHFNENVDNNILKGEFSQNNHYIQLSDLVRGLQKPAQLFLQSQQIHLEKTGEEDSYLEPLELDGLGKFMLNKMLLSEVVERTQHQQDSHQSIIQLLPFDSQLPAGVKRYESLATQKNTLIQAIHTLLDMLDTAQPEIFPHHSQIKALLDEVINRTQAPDITTEATNIIREISTDSEQLFATIGKLMTPCRAQRVAVEIAEIQDIGKDYLPTHLWQTTIITANLPIPNANSQHPDLPEYWFNYLPTNGSEKHLLDMWLQHLCWQVARQTIPEQVERKDGMAIWQFSNVKLVYFAPITHEQAKDYLQDLLMVWQLAQHTVVVLPPSLGIGYVQTLNKDKASTQEKALEDIYKKWLTQPYNSRYISDDNALHPAWQFLLGDLNTEEQLGDYVSTLGEKVYLPMVTQMQTL